MENAIYDPDLLRLKALECRNEAAAALSQEERDLYLRRAVQCETLVERSISTPAVLDAI